MPNRILSRRHLLLLLASIGALVISACGSGTVPQSESSVSIGDATTSTGGSPGGASTDIAVPKDGDKGRTSSAASSSIAISYRTDYLFNGYQVPFGVAVEKGFFADEGLDVTIGIGQGSSTTIQTVASGQDQFGFATADIIATAITNESVPVKMLASYLQSTPNGIVFRPSETDGTIADVLDKGMTQITCAGCAGNSLWAAAVEKAGFDPNRIKVRRVSGVAEAQAFLNSKNAYLITFGPGVYLTVKGHDSSLQFRSLVDYGVEVLSGSLFTSQTMIEEHPETVQRFVNGVSRGWKFALEQPQAAVDIAAKYSKQDPTQLLDSFTMVVQQMLHTENSKNMPVGAIAETDLEDTLQVLKSVGTLHEKPLSLDAYYDSRFILNR